MIFFIFHVSLKEKGIARFDIVQVVSSAMHSL